MFGACFISATAVASFEKQTVPVFFRRINQMNVTAFLAAILFQKLGFGELEELCKALLIIIGEVYEPIPSA